MKKYCFSFIFIFCLILNNLSQTIIINEFSNGPAGAQEYIEFIVVDDNAFYNCGNSTPPCVDIRGWIIDDNSGYHGTGGVAAGCNRFSFNSFWQCIPIGTIITVYNNTERNVSLPPADDLSMSDNNCRLIIPINNAQLFDNNITTPGAVACSYPATGWVAGGNWTRIGMANTGDCARLVNLAGCEVSSLCYGDVNLNTQVYFASGGSGVDNVWSFSDGNSTVQANWTEGCADNETTLDAATCGADNQTPGAANNPLNSAYIAQFNNNCQPIQPLALSLSNTVNQSCVCDGSATITATGSIGPYTYAWYDNSNILINQNSATAINLCGGTYYCIVTSSIGCSDTITVNVGSDNNVTTPTFNAIAPICSGGSFTLSNSSTNGIVGTWSPAINNSQTTTYTFTPNLGQCATSANLTVTVNPTFHDTISQTICSNQLPYSWNTLIFNSSGSQSVTFQSSNGCDSIVTLNLQVQNPVSSNSIISICDNSLPYSWNGLTFNSTGIQTATLQSVGGCDSLATLTLNVNPIYNDVENVTICANQTPFSWNGFSFSNSGSQTTTLTSSLGCDSIVMLNLTVLPTFTTTIDTSICQNQLPITWHGLIFNVAGTQTLNFTAVNGCDSTIILNLQVTPIPQIVSLTGGEYCEGDIVEPFQVVLSGGFPFNLSYSVNGAGQVISSSSDTIYLGNEPGNYLITFISNGICSTSLNELDSIVVHPLPDANFSGGGYFCNTPNEVNVNVNVSGTAPFSVIYAINGIYDTLVISNVNPWGNNLPGINGYYELFEVFDAYCSNTVSDLDTFFYYININQLVVNPSDTALCFGRSVNLTAIPNSPQGVIYWYDSPQLVNPVFSGSVYSFLPNFGSDTLYVQSVIDFCPNIPAVVYVTAIDCEIIVPTAFTPDDDNVNDVWILDGIDAIFPENVVSIYNRWGNLVYQSSKGSYETNPWNGKYKDEPMPVGSYYFIVEYNDKLQSNQLGIVSIIKD